MEFQVGEMVKFETQSIIQRGEIVDLLDDGAVVDWFTVTYKRTGKTVLLNRLFNMGYDDLESLEVKSVEDSVSKYHALMHLAVELGDREEFYRLAEKVNELKAGKEFVLEDTNTGREHHKVE